MSTRRFPESLDLSSAKDPFRQLLETDTRNLTSLNLSSNGLTIVDDLLSALPATLRTLNLASNRLASLRGLKNLTGLESLDASFNQLESTSGLEALVRLRHVKLSSNRIVRVHPL